MRVDLDSYREILDTLTRNKSRSFLTGFGVFWGVFMLVALIGGGQGLKEMLEKNFEGFAQNTVIVWSQQTSKAYKGFRKGRWWSMDYKDITRHATYSGMYTGICQGDCTKALLRTLYQ